jgi:hypothetical protein
VNGDGSEMQIIFVGYRYGLGMKKCPPQVHVLSAWSPLVVPFRKFWKLSGWEVAGDVCQQW